VLAGAVLNQHSRSYTDWLLLAGLCGFLFFWGLGYFGLIGADEPRYAQVAREMLARRSGVTPFLDGKPWLEKPVLYYWETMLVYSIAGVSDWAARVPAALNATLMSIAVYLFLRRFRPGFQLDGALMTASAVGVIGFARAASMDMPLAAMFTIALLAWYGWYESGAKHYLALFYIFLGFATLAKGPVAPFLAASVIIIFLAAAKNLRRVSRTLWIPGIALFCAITLPWYVAVQIRNPEFFRVFILEHNLARFGTGVYHHKEAFWYFVPVVLLGLIPWTIFVTAALLDSIRAWWSERKQLFQPENALNVFLMIWLVVPAVFFSLSQSKLPGYMLPALPAGTLLLAEYVRRQVLMADPRPDYLLTICHSIVAAFPLIPALMLNYILLQHRLPWGSALAISSALAATLAIGMFVTLRTQLSLRMLRFVTLIPVVLSLAAVLRNAAPTLDATLSARPLVNQIDRMENKRLPIAGFRLSRETEYGLEFYRNQIIARYNWGQIPAGEHLVVAPSGLRTAIAERVPERRVLYLGSFAPQGLDYFWVGEKGSH
jgi:4-amino-4-deoxy-L-arabinose transferase-like glycosyltransferase